MSSISTHLTALQAPALARLDDRHWRWATLGVVSLLAVFILLTFNQHGISNDEELQHNYGRLLLDFYGSGLQDHRAFSYFNLYLYGGLFDMVTAALESLLPISVWDLRHLLTALCGFGGMVLTARLARGLAGERAGFFAILALALTGAWTGALFTHTKDIPFASAMIYAVYAITRLLPTLPRPSWSRVLNVGVAIGCAMGMRVGGVFAVFYLGAAVLLALMWQQRSNQGLLRCLLQCLPRLLAALAIAVVIMAFAWPWSVMGWDHLVRAAAAFSHFSFDMQTIMNGHYYKLGEVPRSYLPAYLLVRLPEFTLVGIALAVGLSSLALIHRRIVWQTLPIFTPTLLAAIFPIVFVIATRPTLYNGIRHFTFVLPPLAVLAALGLDAAWNRLKSRRILHVGFAAVLLSMVVDVTMTLGRLHPYEYVAYNRLVGGLHGAYDRWEMDYWGDSIRQASALLNQRIETEGTVMDRPYTVAVCAQTIQAATYLSPSLQVTKDWIQADFFISPTQTNCDAVLAGEVIGTVARDDVPLTVIKDRRKLIGDERLPGSHHLLHRQMHTVPQHH